ncbi:PepSY domain-containing protein [Comamonas sp. NLF-1-9]|uniref:PepSY domain-containing protein n=1 Tax=Comamonas sp. NLF-1-9 TaxID=2853163 RepID=UPI001C45A76C|nr:PepSY domain-containing protein [Comamonas sp. NLF-1-9]QXL84015.1 PepSY domain-containing protein [Comamonas sp. NLF-1-9]
MNRRSKTIVAAALATLALAVGALPALAGDDCKVPASQWQSRNAVRQMASEQGWQVQRLKVDDGCYELRGIDAQGQRFKAKIDPQTLEIVKIKRKQRERRQGRDTQLAPDPEAVAIQPSSSSPFTSGSRPRAQVE